MRSAILLLASIAGLYGQNGVSTVPCAMGSWTGSQCVVAHNRTGNGGPGSTAYLLPPTAAISGFIINTFAGTDYTFPGDGQPAVNGPLGFVVSVAVDAVGNVYIADASNRMISRVGSDGILRVVAGTGILGDSGDEGDADSASLGNLDAVTVAPDGSLYIGIFGGLIRRVTPDGIIHSVANLKLAGDTGIGGHSQAIAVDAAGNVYYADVFNHRIRKISPSGTVSTFAGTGQSGFSGDGGPATTAALSFPNGVRFDAAGNLLIVDSGNKRIRRVASNGIISSITTKTPLGAANAVDYDSAGNLYVLGSQTGIVQKVAPDGTITVVAGSGTRGFSGDGGPAAKAQFNFPGGLAVDNSGNIFVADTFNNRVRHVAADGIISTFAGNGLYRFTPDGTPAALGFFRSLYGIVVDSKGSLYIADRDEARIKKVLADGTLVTVAGTGQDLAAGNGPLPAAGTPISLPTAPAVDAKGNLYFIEGGFRVRRVTTDGAISTYAGGGGPNPGDGGPATNAFLDVPTSLAIDAAGNLYISENGSTANRIRKVSPNGIITTLAGAGPAGFSGDGGPATQAALKRPSDMALDRTGNIYFLDTGNSRVRKIDNNGIISTYVGGGSSSADGVPSTQAIIDLYSGLTIDAAGNLYVVDNGRGVVRVVSSNGTIMTLAGSGKFGFSGDGGPALLASFEFPNGLAIDASGNLYIADSLNFRVRVVTASAPTFTRSPSSLSFTARSGDAAPAPLQVALTSSVSGLPYTISSSTTTGGDWLRTSASSPVAPATVNVTVDPSGLAPATYQGTITFTSPIVGVAPLTTSVALVVQAAAPSLLAVDAKGVSFSFVRGSPAANRRVLVQNSGGGTVNFTIGVKTASGGTWLSASPSRGSAIAAAPVSLTITANPAGLDVGTYSGTVTVADSDGATTLPIPVTMTISGSGQSIRLSQKGLTFVAVVGGGSSPPQNITILNTGQGTVQFTAQAITAGSPNWISVTPSNGASTASQPSALTVNVNQAGLSAGDYFARIEISSSSADNSPQEAVAVLHLLPAGTDPGPSTQPAGVVFTGVAGGADPSAQAVQVSNLTASPITFGSSAATVDGGTWLVHQPATATVPPGSIRLVVQPRVTGLAAGVYRGAIVLVFSNGSIQTIGVLLVLAPSGATPASARDAAGCAPSQLLPLVTSLGSNFNVPASFPTPIEVRVVDDCGNPITSGSVVATFSNGDPALSLISLGDGRWSGTWLSRNVSQNQLSITVSAEIPQQELKGTAQISGGLNGNASPPVIGAGGVVSASSLNGQAPLSPGAMVSIFGAKMSNGTAQAPSLPLGTQLAGTSVLVAGKSLPLLYSSDGQVNALLPFDIPVNARIQMLVSRGAQISVPEEISIAPAQPGIFTIKGTGQGQGHIYVASSNGSQRLADQTAPAKAGDVIVIYCSGLGPVDQPVADGASAPSSPLAHTVNPVIVTIGGVSTNASFAGLAPGFSGLYQINAFVPAGVTAGDQVAVIINIAGQASPPVIMAVR